MVSHTAWKENNPLEPPEAVKIVVAPTKPELSNLQTMWPTTGLQVAHPSSLNFAISEKDEVDQWFPTGGPRTGTHWSPVRGRIKKITKKIVKLLELLLNVIKHFTLTI